MTRCIRHALLALCILFAGDVWAEDFVRLTNRPAIYIETFNQAPIVSKRVDEELMPKWFRQRGVDISLLEKLKG